MISTFKRYEKKFLVDRIKMKKLLDVLSNHMDLDPYCKNGNRYTISTIYYDTDNNDVIRNSLQKPKYKEKLRVRSYGLVKNEDEKVFIELKKKVNGIVTKRRAILTYQQAKNYLENNEMPKDITYLNEQILNEVSIYRKENEVKPVIYMSYERLAYFCHDDKNLRITFDFNLMTRREDLRLNSKLTGNKLLPDDKVLMEIKFSNAMPLWLARTLSNLEIYSESFSKYGADYKNLVASKKNKNKNTKAKTFEIDFNKKVSILDIYNKEELYSEREEKLC